MEAYLRRMPRERDPGAFRRIANELDPNYVPESASQGRRPVPGYFRWLLEVFGVWWLPRVGLSLVVLGTIAEVSAMVIFAGRSYLLGILVFVLGVALGVGGSVMWGAYRARHWLPGHAASTAPLTPRVPRGVWTWMTLAAVAVFGGLGVTMWLIAADGSPRAVVAGFGFFLLCTGVAGAEMVKRADQVSTSHIRVFGFESSRLSRVFIAAGVFGAATLFVQAALLPATR